MKNLDDWEEAFSGQERKDWRKDRKIARFKDRSQFRKSDLDQKLKQQARIKTRKEGDLEGRVLAILPEGVVVSSGSREFLCTLKGAMKQKNIRTKNLIAVGDIVHFTEEGSITEVQARWSILSRADNLSRRKEQLIAVNIDQVLIMCSVIEPSLKPFLIDRYIIAAQKGNMQPVIVINKIDLLEKQESLDIFLKEVEQTYRSLGIPVFSISSVTGEGICALKEAMQGKASVISGQSGVGKTSLINAIMGSSLKTGSIISQTLKGAHTTTAAKLIPLEGEGFCIDTPGIRSFGIWDLKKDELQSYFSEIFAVGAGCRYPDCHHIEAPGCVVKQALEEDKISFLRFESYCALMDGLHQKHRLR